jgi:hypothetical protein
MLELMTSRLRSECSQLISNIIKFMPVTTAERSKACTVFARSQAGIVGSNRTQGIEDWCLCVCAFLCACVPVDALRRADHPAKEFYRMSKIK